MTYWVGIIDHDPFCFLLTSEFIPNGNSSALWNKNSSKLGKTFTIDFCIGNEKYLEKGLASLTLEAFTRFLQKEVNTDADTFFIDPDVIQKRGMYMKKQALSL